ncbi:hypothetical protein O0L34_g17486 [Tuta absoluta]|nr:hypothetical protein O0L34_g17486 [Tuta absoluta]
MGSPISPLMADIFMEDFEDRALRHAPAVPKMYKRYVDDTFTILPQDQVTAFLNHLNSIHPNIKFTMESEQKNQLAFLDILKIKNTNGTISHSVYRKTTHTDRYLNGNSHHHPSQLAAVGTSLFQRARGICDPQHLDNELKHVRRVLHENNLKPPRQRHRNRAKPSTVERQPAYLPYLKGITDKIGRILKRASIKTIFKPPRKISQYSRSVKCNIPLQDPGVYKLDCDCGLSYIGETKRNVSTRLKEHIADVKNRHDRQSAVCKHIMDNPTHYVRFDKAAILVREKRLIPRKVREAIEIQKHPNFNRDTGWGISSTWTPLITQQKNQIQHTVRPTTQDTVSAFCVEPGRYARQLRNRWR